MKSTFSFVAAWMVAALVLIIPSCKEDPYYNAPGDNAYNGGAVVIENSWDDEDDLVIPAGVKVINVDSAKKICSALSSGQITSEVYYVKGLVTSYVDKYSHPQRSGAGTFYMVDSPVGETATFEAYSVTNLGGNPFVDISEVQDYVGSWIIVEAKLTKYNTILETQNGGKIIARTYHKVNTEGDGSLENPYTIGDIIALNRADDNDVYVRGIVRGVAGENDLEFAPGEDGGFSMVNNILLSDYPMEDSEGEMIENLVYLSLPRGSERTLLNLGTAEQVESVLGHEVIVRGKMNKVTVNILPPDAQTPITVSVMMSAILYPSDAQIVGAE